MVAADRNGVIGVDGQLPWHLPDDLRHFRSVTDGGVVIMGRLTYDSIGRPLPNRTNIVLSRTQRNIEGVQVAASLAEAMELAAATGANAVFVIGGGQLYREAMGVADVVHLTRVDAEVHGDTTFPPLDHDRMALMWSQAHEADEAHSFGFTFERWERRNSTGSA